MIGYVRGIVSHIFGDYCFIDVQGVGYRVYIAASTRQKLNTGTEASLFTYLNVREDALMLYGFYTQDEYQLFLKLTSVGGIGPKVALGILSAISPDAFRLAVGSKNLTVLTKIPGIGKKTAERIIVELHDKIGVVGTDSQLNKEEQIVVDETDDATQQALAALTALGYTQAEVMPAINRHGAAKSVQELIKLVLRDFGGR
ncbi:Holliday junction branch migration protein RuvA|uniref:Holliday junction branch migration complex subunit RuvA n=1 Tax=Dendrosporobacter quercicolus TaxID=146817 RepID=A0A1G9KNQ9_9FIRM|nr:Holliday junction branch migration protein RuvA [Dendrosporobacter quercicolus]NSL46462.1 Holliday junction branch migration protein RuvA [Dendrosporobacter quercicolus DSM 1736]SDL51351.1 Holliday junction DNA helicase subunit RuvA [Dendrosporobacter quercicolus]